MPYFMASAEEIRDDFIINNLLPGCIPPRYSSGIAEKLLEGGASEECGFETAIAPVASGRARVKESMVGGLNEG